MKYLILVLAFILSGVVSFVACDEEKQVLLPIVTVKTEECKATKITEGYMLKCGDAAPIIITNGTDGRDGRDGEDGKDANIQIIYLCGNTAGEILIRMPDGKLVVYRKADCLNINGYLSVLTPGDYTTSDGYNNKFTIDENYNIIETKCSSPE